MMMAAPDDGELLTGLWASLCKEGIDVAQLLHLEMGKRGLLRTMSEHLFKKHNVRTKKGSET